MIIYLLQLALRVFWVFPIKKNKVVLTAYNGRLFSCSPKYIAEGLIKTGKYEVIYALRNSSTDVVPCGIKRIKYRSIGHFYHLLTAKFVIFNSTGISGLLPYRKQQVVINTWHGGYSFKVIGNDIFTDEASRKKRAIAGNNLTYFLSGSKMATDQHSSAMSVAKEKFLNIGLPRNDVLFTDHEMIKDKVYKNFGLDHSAKIVLYAPTYRDGPVKSITQYEIQEIDCEGVVRALNSRFGDGFVFMYKAHHDMIPTNLGEHCINASYYSDIQELMCASEVIITDYSSCMADFALQRKPGFLYTPDIKEYESVHPFSMNPQKWPYQVAASNEELISNINNYDVQEGLNVIEDFFSRIGNCDEGFATNMIISIMDKHTFD